MKCNRLIIIFLSLLICQASFSQPVLTSNLGHTEVIFNIAFSPDGKTIASASKDKTIKLWNIETGQEIRTLKGHTSTVRAVVFCPDGKTIASAGADKTIKLWNAETGQVTKTLQGHADIVLCLVLHPNGNILASGSRDKTIKLWDIETGQEIKTFTEHNGFVEHLSFRPDGKIIAAGSFSSPITLINTETGQKIKTLKGKRSLVFSPNGETIASVGLDKTLNLWNVGTGSEIKTFTGHVENVSSISFNPEGTVLASGSWEVVKLWDVNTGKEIQNLELKNKSNVYSATFSPNGEIIAAACGNIIKLWNAKTGQEVKTLEGNKNYLFGVAVSPDGKNIASGSRYGIIDIWNIETGKRNKTIKGHTDVITCVAFSPDGKIIATGSWDRSVKLWNAETGKEINNLEGHEDYIESVAFSPDGQTIASASRDNTIRLWNVSTGRKSKTLKGHTNQVRSLSFSPDGKILASGSYDKSVILWNAKNGRKINTLQGHTDIVMCVAFSPDSKTIASGGGDKTIKLWNAETGQVIKTFTAHIAESISFSPDGKTIASASWDNTVKLWITQTGNELKTLNGHVGYVESVAFSPNGKFVVSTGYDCSVKIWKQATGDLLVNLYSLNNSEEWLMVTPDNYWDGSNNCGEYVGMVSGFDFWKIDQFAVKNNRPDIVLDRLDSENTPLKQHFLSQYKKRLRKLGLTENQVEKGYHTPEAKIVATKLDGKFAELEFEFNDSKYQLKSYNLFVNDVPLFYAGKPLAQKNVNLNQRVELTRGENKIEVSCRNEKGTESFRDVVLFNYNGQANRDIYLLAIGVSDYEDSNLNLQYAHKDALDLEQVAKSMKGKGFENVYTKTLTNEQVTTANIKAAKDFVKNAKVDDTFILFIAGHGMHDTDEEATYYYLTHNTDLKNLKGTAATFETIEDLLQGIPPRNKLFLMDACESGELDPEDEVQYLASATQAGVNSRGFKKANNVIASEAKQPVANRSYLLNRNRYIYNDLVRRSGAIVFSSSKGGELSYERSDIENGLFTEYIMKALTTTEADANKDGTVTTDELRNYVSVKVAEASDGLQHPTVDRDNIYQKFGFGVK